MKRISFAFIAALSLLVFSSCEKNTETVWTAVVTAKTQPDSSFVYQLEETSLLVPTNVKTNPFGRQVRAFIQYYDRGELEKDPSGQTRRSGEVFFQDSILTKCLEPSTAYNDSIYGHEPIELYNQWTLVEDGYFTVQFQGYWGYSTIPHKIHMIKGTDPANPLVLELRHDYNGAPITPGLYGNGFAAFDIRELLIQDRETYDIVLKYRGYYGKKSFTFSYTPGKSAARANVSQEAPSARYEAVFE